jgi:hypothetical protein
MITWMYEERDCELVTEAEAFMLRGRRRKLQKADSCAGGQTSEKIKGALNVILQDSFLGIIGGTDSKLLDLATGPSV